MMDSLRLIYQRLLSEVSTEHYRFLYHQINLESRLIGLTGARGVGKTTLMLQLIKEQIKNKQKAFYVSADHIYFSQTTLYEFVEHLFLHEGVEVFFIDEVHKYKNWDQELKNLYDGFPSIRIVFSGSSSLDLRKGHDLSRRATLYALPGLSFREYLNFTKGKKIQPVSFSALVSQTAHLGDDLGRMPGIQGLFQSYLKEGFYPFAFEEAKISLPQYHEKLLQVIDKTIYEDIANFYRLKTSNIVLFKKLLLFLASIPPGKLNVHSLAKNLSSDDKTVHHYLSIFQETELVNLIPFHQGGNQGLRKPAKALLNNTNLQYALSSVNGPAESDGMLREIFFAQSIRGAGLELFYHKTADYQVENVVFEIGGKSKTRTQLKGLEHAFLVKDGCFVFSKGCIPLLFFGFLY